MTDYDTGVEHDDGVAPVSQEQVFAFFEENLHHVRALLHELVPTLPPEPAGCDCAGAIGPLHASRELTTADTYRTCECPRPAGPGGR